MYRRTTRRVENGGIWEMPYECDGICKTVGYHYDDRGSAPARGVRAAGVAWVDRPQTRAESERRKWPGIIG